MPYFFVIFFWLLASLKKLNPKENEQITNNQLFVPCTRI